VSGEKFFPAERPRLTDAERRRINAQHYRRDYEYVDYVHFVSEQVRLPNPVCAYCGELWGDVGCPTVRALHLLAHTERERDESKQKEKQAIFALNQIAVRGELARPEQNRTLQINMRVQEIALVHGGISDIDETLSRIRREMKTALDNLKRDPVEEMAKAFNEGLANLRRFGGAA
jgi:hypothetical protein